MASFTTYSLVACVDCVMQAANGECESPGPSWSVERFAEGMEGGHLSIGEGEPHFSSTACGLCGSQLAGDRFDCELLVSDQ